MITEKENFLRDEDIWALSITVTGRCNCNCSYCHFYARHKKQAFNDISDTLFNQYIKVIKEIKSHYHANLQVRFSGGEPLILGDRMFELASRLYEQTGIDIYILSNGLLINEDVIRKSKANHIKAFLVSIENPFDVSSGAPDPDSVLDIIKRYDSLDVRVLPAIMVIRNNHFKDMPQIADYVYQRIGCLPSFAEINYQGLERITANQLQEFRSAIYQIASKYLHKTPIKIFPYLSPELYIPGVRNYLTELDMENTIACGSNENVIENLYNKLLHSYRKNPCTDSSCEWYEDCQIIKWLWIDEFKGKTLTSEDRHAIFCNLRKALNESLYQAIMDKERTGA